VESATQVTSEVLPQKTSVATEAMRQLIRSFGQAEAIASVVTEAFGGN
jgi:hypothetical protein